VNKTFTTVLKYTLFLAIGVALMWWAYKDVNLEEMKHSLNQANWGWIVVALILNYSATAFRGVRWNTLLEPLGHRANTWTCIHSVAFGYLMNDLIPRSGEVARCTLLNRAEKVPIDKLIGTVILERIVDVLMLGLIIVITVFIHNAALTQLFTQVDAGKGKLLLYVLIGGLVALGLFMLLLRMFRELPFVARVSGFFTGVFNGLKSILALRRKGQFLMWTLAIWGTWLVMTQCMMFALEETKTLGVADSLFLMVAASLGMLIPTQGGLGAYHFMTMLAFVTLGFANADDPQRSDVGLTFAAISWGGKTILEVIMGSIGFIAVTVFKMKKVTT
jgi:glycosyltransferase 2 family protein